MVRKLSFVQMDVFTQTPLQGNQLAVFTDGRGLSDAEMQTIARETNLSETTFILPRDAATEDREGVRVRIFTVAEELPFAGHPTLGTAAVIRTYSHRDNVALHLNVGKIPVYFTDQAAGLAFGEMPQNDPEFIEIHDAAEVAKIGGLSPEDLRRDVPVQTVSTGNRFVIVPVKSLEAIQRLQFNHAAAKTYLESHSGKFFFWLCAEATHPDAKFHARMIFYNGEDPATGSAAGPAVAWMVKHSLVAPNERVIIEQGVEIARRSHMHVRAEMHNGRVHDVRVGGYAVEIARGEYRLP
jgi:trans-2,3-dihydro-3-hydroxyanthranilate isomerase